MPSITGFSSSRAVLNTNTNTATHKTTQSANAGTDFIQKNIKAVSNSPDARPRVANAQPRVVSHRNNEGVERGGEYQRQNAYIKFADGEVFPASASLSISAGSAQNI